MMYMAADSNMNFQNGVFPSSFCNQQLDSFQPGTVNSMVGLVQGGFNNSGGINSSPGMMIAGNPGALYNVSSMMDGNSSENHHIDLIAGLKHDTGLAADWSYKEQALLRHGLIKYVDQPSIMKYIKIAALLPEKSVRDVALRSQWMSRKENGKRRKLEEHYIGKRSKDRKENMGDSSMNVNIHPFGNAMGYPFMMHHANNNSLFLKEAPIIDNASQHLLEENARVLNQIAANLESVKIQDNVNLFLRTRNNITAILNSYSRIYFLKIFIPSSSMSGMPGIMSQMPPLPVSVSDDLVASILPASQAFIFGSQTCGTLKQEPRC